MILLSSHKSTTGRISGRCWVSRPKTSTQGTSGKQGWQMTFPNMLYSKALLSHSASADSFAVVHQHLQKLPRWLQRLRLHSRDETLDFQSLPLCSHPFWCASRLSYPSPHFFSQPKKKWNPRECDKKIQVIVCETDWYLSVFETNRMQMSQIDSRVWMCVYLRNNSCCLAAKKGTYTLWCCPGYCVKANPVVQVLKGGQHHGQRHSFCSSGAVLGTYICPHRLLWQPVCSFTKWLL